jgi:hypothetical protein
MKKKKTDEEFVGWFLASVFILTILFGIGYYVRETFFVHHHKWVVYKVIPGNVEYSGLLASGHEEAVLFKKQRCECGAKRAIIVDLSGYVRCIDMDFVEEMERRAGISDK